MTAKRQAQRGASQPALPFRRDGRWGGARPGSGRKPLPPGQRKGVPHRARGRLDKSQPIHITVRLKRHLPGLRKNRTYRVLRRCFAAGSERFGFRLVHYSVQANHLHLLCEARDRRALSRGMQGLLVRVAKAMNKLWGRRGGVFAGRYHEHVLKTPREVRNALAYVLNNLWRHARSATGRAAGVFAGLDGFASGCWCTAGGGAV